MSNYSKTDYKAEQIVDAKPELPKEVAVANCKKLNIRSMPSKRASIVTVVTEGTRLRVLADPEEDSAWVKVETEDKKTMQGYVMREYVRVI